MKTILVLFILCFCFAHAADLPPVNVPVFITVNGVSSTARYVELSTAAVTAGVLVYGGTGAPGTDVASWTGKIVLLDRGPAGFGFFAKAEAVRLAGGLGCIVANIAPGPREGTLGAGNATALPVVTVTMEDGLGLRAKAGSQAILGPIPSVPTPAAIPDPAGHEGEYLVSQGGKYAFAKRAPGIVSISLGGLAFVGDPVTLSASSDGLPQPALQWFKDGQPLAGATGASFSIAAVQKTDGGEYRVTATNDSGSTTSPAFTLMVQPLIGLAR